MMISVNPTWNDTVVLAANTAKLYEIPANVDKIFIGSTVDVHIKLGASDAVAAIVTEDVLDGSGCLFNPDSIIEIPYSVTHISIISASSGLAFISSWKKRSA
jgi:hypothetical protein